MINYVLFYEQGTIIIFINFCYNHSGYITKWRQIK